MIMPVKYNEAHSQAVRSLFLSRTVELPCTYNAMIAMTTVCTCVILVSGFFFAFIQPVSYEAHMRTFTFINSLKIHIRLTVCICRSTVNTLMPSHLTLTLCFPVCVCVFVVLLPLYVLQAVRRLMTATSTAAAAHA